MSTAAGTEVEHEIGPTGALSLRVRSTTVRLRGVDGGAVRIRGKGAEPLDGVDLETAPGGLTVTVRSGRAPDLEIDVPSLAALTVEGASADIEARGFGGRQHYRTASGDLRLDRVRGSITAEAMSGDIDIVADGVTSILGRSVSGDLAIRAGTLEALRATTTSGDVRVAGRFAGPGPFGIETVSGDAILAPADGVRILAATITGEVRSDVSSRQEGPRGQRSLVIGDGGPTISFRSLSGDLRVVRAAHLAPSSDVVRDQPSVVVPSPSVTPVPPTPPTPPTASATGASGPSLDVHGRTRLDILRALERGDIDIDEAGRRLETLDSSDPMEADRV